LNAEHYRIENKQEARKNQYVVYGAFVYFFPVPGRLKHKESEEYECGKDKPEKFPCKNDFQVITYNPNYY
jgi:hypothetical protein